MQDLPTTEDEVSKVANPDIDNIVGTNKVTRSGRVFSLEISPKIVATPVRITTTESTVEAWGKEPIIEPAQKEAPKKLQLKTPLDNS